MMYRESMFLPEWWKSRERMTTQLVDCQKVEYQAMSKCWNGSEMTQKDITKRDIRDIT